MNLEKIKAKYKEILQEPEADSPRSDEQWELAYSRMKNKRRKHILTESQCMNRSSFSMNHASHIGNDENMTKVKEKLAQSIANLNKKDLQIQELKSENIKSKEQIKILQQQILELKDQLRRQEEKIIEQKVAYSCIEKNMENIEKNVQSEKMDKELLQRQIQYYQAQIEGLKIQSEQKSFRMQQMKKEMKTVEKYKSMAHKLKEDVTRLRQLLGQTEKYKLFASKIDNKHYIGKSCKEHQCWVGEDLIHDVETFLKKQQVGVGNKEFAVNLVKFVAKHEEQAKIIGEKKVKKMYASKQKDQERKINHSLNFIQIREQQLKKSQIGNSILKSRRNTLHDSKKTDSYIYDKLEKSLAAHSFNRNREICIQILNSFRKGILQLTQAKQLKRKKLIKLVDWVIDGVLALFPKQRASINGLGHFHGDIRMMDTITNGDFRLDTDQIKITI